MTATYECKEGAETKNPPSDGVSTCSSPDENIIPFTWSSVDFTCAIGEHNNSFIKHLYSVSRLLLYMLVSIVLTIACAQR